MTRRCGYGMAKPVSAFAIFEGHTRPVSGALEMPDGRLLSWSMDTTLRIWHRQSGVCLMMLEGHAFWTIGALVLPDAANRTGRGDTAGSLAQSRRPVSNVGISLATFGQAEGHLPLRSCLRYRRRESSHSLK